MPLLSPSLRKSRPSARSLARSASLPPLPAAHRRRARAAVALEPAPGSATVRSFLPSLVPPLLHLALALCSSPFSGSRRAGVGGGAVQWRRPGSIWRRRLAESAFPWRCLDFPALLRLTRVDLGGVVVCALALPRFEFCLWAAVGSFTPRLVGFTSVWFDFVAGIRLVSSVLG